MARSFQTRDHIACPGMNTSMLPSFNGCAIQIPSEGQARSNILLHVSAPCLVKVRSWDGCVHANKLQHSISIFSYRNFRNTISCGVSAAPVPSFPSSLSCRAASTISVSVSRRAASSVCKSSCWANVLQCNLSLPKLWAWANWCQHGQHASAQSSCPFTAATAQGCTHQAGLQKLH